MTAAHITRRGLMSGAAGVLLMPVACRAQAGNSIGLFPQGCRITLPRDVDRVRSTGHAVEGIGAATYVHDPDLDERHVHRYPLSSFHVVDGRVFRLMVEGPINPEVLGLRQGLSGAHARTNAAAILEALSLSRNVVLPPGIIDLRLAGGLSLPPVDGQTLAGAGWTTRVIGGAAIFNLPSLSELTLRDMWIEQTAGGGPAIQSYHCNLRDVRLVGLKITVADARRCRSNAVSLVMDNSHPAADGIAGLDGLLVEKCWFAPGRMGIEIQNHGPGERLYRYRNVVVRDCTFWKTPIENGMGISLSGWGDRCLVVGNRFVDCGGPNVELVGSDRTTIEGNQFKGSAGPPVAISNMRVIRQCRIVGNTGEGAPPVGFFIEAVDGIEISDNRFATSGSFILKGRNIVIRRNVLTGKGTTQIFQIDRARSVIIENNTLVSRGGKPDGRPMIAVFNGASDCVIRRNRMERADYDDGADALWIANAPDVRALYAGENIRVGR